MFHCIALVWATQLLDTVRRHDSFEAYRPAVEKVMGRAHAAYETPTSSDKPHHLLNQQRRIEGFRHKFVCPNPFGTLPVATVPARC